MKRPRTSAGLGIAETIPALRQTIATWRQDGRRIALVPTMGALHAGHISLIDAARARGCATVASIFVNPTQFAPTEDLSKYPRTFENDCRMLKDAGCELVFAPQPEEVYPGGFCTTISVAGPAKAGLEDRFRPFHFDGVATVVAKLFTMVQPDLAIFGEKDYQQFQVVRRMVLDLNLPIDVIGAPTIREADGLAMSSRNRFLSAAERDQAAVVPATLQEAVEHIRSGESPERATAKAATRMSRSGFVVDYMELRDAATLAPVVAYTGQPCRILAAGRIGSTRLIDNMAV